jgi:5-formyltetrahydrofolate cyclo-ligase
LLKTSQDKEDAKYWALKKEANNLEIRYVVLQQNKESLQQQL